MSKLKWTLGPWLIRDQDKRTGCPYVGPPDQDVATIHSCPGEIATQANARLVAAAPALYAALERAVPWLGKLIADGGHLNAVAPNDAIGALDQAEAALKAARGE